MPTVSMSQAAVMVGKSKGTLSKALKSGRLSAVEKTDNGYLIEISELYRVFPAKPSEPVAEARLETPDETARIEADGLRRELELMRDQVDDLRSQRDAWQRQAEAAQRLLTGPPAGERRGFLGLFRRG